MRMQDPDAGFRASVTLHYDEKYRARLEEIEERESTVPTARPGSTYLAYKFSLHELDNTPVLDDISGLPYLQWHTCNNATAYSKPPYIGSREIAEALMGQKLSTDEVRELIDAGWDNELIGHTCLVDLQLFVDEKTGNERVRIIRILPDRRSRVARPVGPAGFEVTDEPAPVVTPPTVTNGAQIDEHRTQPDEREERRRRLEAELAALE